MSPAYYGSLLARFVKGTFADAGHAAPIASQKRPYPCVRAIRQALFYSAYVLFGTVGLATSLGAGVSSVVATSARSRWVGQRIIHHLFGFFIWYVRACGLLNLRTEGLNALRGRSNIVLVANHPSLLDAVFLAGHLPNVFCLMKASVLHNLVLCGQARLAGYVNNESGLGLVKACKARMREGSNLLVFPEGTRTRDGRLGPFKMGFAVVARALQAPVQTVLIEYDHTFLGKRWPFLKAPPFPLNCTITLGRQFDPANYPDSLAFGREIEGYLKEALAQRVSGPGIPAADHPSHGSL